MVKTAAHELEAADRRRGEGAGDELTERAASLCALAGLAIEEMASDDGREILSRAFAGGVARPVAAAG